MLDNLINSKVRLGLLALFFANPNVRYYLQEIIDSTKFDRANVHKELANLVSGKIIKISVVGRKKYYSLDRENVYFSGLKSIFDHYLDQQSGDKWFLLEEINNVYPAVASTYLFYKYNRDFFKKEFDLDFGCQGLEVYNDGVMKLYFIKKEFSFFAKAVFEKLISNPGWGHKLNETVRSYSEQWVEVGKEILNTNLSQLSNEELFSLYSKAYDLQIRSHVTGWPSNTVDFENSMFSKHLVEILEQHKSKLGLDFSIGEVFSVLTTPTEQSFAQKEHLALVDLYTRIHNDDELKKVFLNFDARLILEKIQQNFPDTHRAIDQHRKDYGWLTYQYEGPGWDNMYFVEIISSLLRQGSTPEDLLNENDNKGVRLTQDQTVYLDKFQLNEIEREMFAVAKDFVFNKGYRKDNLFFCTYCNEFLMKEIGRRTYLSLRQVRHLYPKEVELALLEGKIDAAAINERIKFHVLYSGPEGEKKLSGPKAKKFLDELTFLEEKVPEVTFFEGDTASPGRVRGVVCKINSRADISKMKKGNILVSIATSPDLISAIKQSAAIVTDMGGVTCHAAIVSRELGIPCVVGTKIATKLLQDGDSIEVDASHGRIFIINKINKKK